MKVTKSHLRQLIKEELGADPALLSAISKLADKIDNLDVSVDYLAATLTGEDPVSLGYGQVAFGRAARKKKSEPPEELAEIIEQEPMGFEEALQRIIKEELAAVMESRPYQAGEKRPGQIMQADQGLIRYLKNYIGNMVGDRENPKHDPAEVVEALQRLISSFSLGNRKRRAPAQPTGLPPTTRTMAPLREYVANDRAAQATLNHLSVQEQRILVQVKELMGMEDAEFEELLKDPRRLGDLISLISQEREMQIAEANRTAKGNVTQDAREDHATLSGGRFPIFDKKSALAALKLRGHGTTKAERKKIINKAAKYAKSEAEDAREEDKKD